MPLTSMLTDSPLHRPLLHLSAFVLLISLTSSAAQNGRAPQASRTKQTQQQRTGTNGSSALSKSAVDELAKEAEAARAAGDSRSAIEKYEQALKARPAWAEGWWYLGTLQYDSDQYAQAIPAFQQVVKLEPKMGSAFAFLGLCEFKTGDFKQSLQNLRRAKELGIGEATTARVSDYHLAMLLNVNRDFDAAAGILMHQFGQEQLTPQVATVMGLSLLHMAVLPSDLDISKKELVYTAGKALMEMARKRNAEALDILQQLKKDFPGQPYLHYASALALASQEKTDEAIAELQAELQISGANIEPHLLLTKINLQKENPAEALKSAHESVRLQPKNAYAHALLAQCYEKLGKQAEAARESATAKSLGLSVGASQSAAPLVAVQSITPADADKDPDLAAIRQRAVAAREANDLEATISAYKQGLELRPNWAEGVLYLGTIYYTTERYADALPLAQRLVRLQPSVGMAWAMLGLCEFKLGSYEDALVHLSRGRDLGFPQGGPTVSEANYHVGILLNRRGDFDAGRAILLEEAKGGTRAADAKFALGIALLRLRRLPAQIADDERQMVETAGEIAVDLSGSDYGPACAKFDSLVKQYPSRSYIYNAYGWTLMSISRFDAAVEQYRREIEVDPKSSEAYLGLAAAAIKTNNFQQARDAAAKAVELDPDSAMAHGHYGRALMGLGQVDQGIVELEKAVHIAVQIPELHYSLSRAYAKANRPKDAERERQIFVRLNKEANKK